MSKLLITIGFLLTIVVCSGCLGEGLPLQRVYDFSEQIPVGTPRDEVVAILSEDSWYHEICRYYSVDDRDFVNEIFFYDNREWDRSEIVILYTVLVGEEYVLHDLSGAEPNEWHTYYKGCYDRSMFTE